MRDYMLKIYPEILDKDRKNIFDKLVRFKNIGYLAGGTALAMQIKHRKSYDFDVFVKAPITHLFRKKVESIFGKYEYYVNTSDQISFNTHNNIGVTFFCYFYKPLFPPIRTESINLSSVSDIAADKAHTIGRRAIWRDYVDFYFLLKLGISNIQRVIDLADEKFGREFVKTQFLEQLVYFKDLAVTKIEYIGESPSPSEIQIFLEKQVEQYLKKTLGK